MYTLEIVSGLSYRSRERSFWGYYAAEPILFL